MRISRKSSIIALCLVACLLVFGSFATAKAPVLRMATTTSTDNTGLLDYLAPILLKDTGIEIQWVSVGTGKALEYGRNGDVDVVLTHSPSQEDRFMEEGAGVNRRKVMYNDFVLIGPANDPAGVKGKPVVQAFAAIAAKKQKLVSRADKSGTHTAELKLLERAGVKDFDKADWYVQTGQGMLKTINIADEQNGYALSDRGTFIKYEAGLEGRKGLVIICEGDKELLNRYSVMAVSPMKHPNVKYDLALKYIDWITSSKVQKDIADFKVEGKQLFFPEAETRYGH
ncbi:substrate-binding domain-containing protein [Synergistes jonesii]|uniref:Tungsten ABC transporter substrate-binding protein n=2 Tax=Synergistes jonesii TaxID=2754 RepID=A0A073IPH1_9BACT|nr:substrate-binding domain-containing protein [Synergistes jonesii]KEJ91624.1 tungsten ABC transporter substrate-binding protein [Synergistes jonesii]MDY2984658.1 substrate-binding domain-containing protein [Synergistes jonesii]